MTSFEELALAQALFIGSHWVLCAASLRDRVVALVGELPWRIAYSLLSLKLFGQVLWKYWVARHQGTLFWHVPWTTSTWAVVTALATLGTVLVVASLLRPSPGAVVPGSPEPRGALRWTRHPMMWGITLTCLAHLVAFGYLGDVLFWGGLVLLALGGAWHQDLRKGSSEDPAVRAFYSSTCFVPLTGPGRLQGLREAGVLPWVLGGFLAWGIRYGHRFIP